MSTAKPIVVFVDDNPDELDLFKEVWGSEFDLVLGQSADEGLKNLDWRTPDLILLDVYIPVDGKDHEVPEAIASTVIDTPPDQGELRLAYNNMVWAQERFQELQEIRGHGVQGGLKLARIFSAKFPQTPLIGYSRKSNPVECLTYLASIPTAIDFVQKPNDPKGWDETSELTKKESARLSALFQSYLGTRIPEDKKGDIAAMELLEKVDYLALLVSG